MAAENALKSREVSAMIRQGFISDPTLTFSPSRSITRVYSPSSSLSKTLSSPPPPFSPSTQTHQGPTRQSQSQSQTLYAMMSEEQSRESKFSDDKRRKLQDRVWKLLDEAPFGNPKSEESPGDVKLTVVSKDGFRVSVDVHKSVLASKSRFFAEKLHHDRGVSHSVEISDCDDVEIYVETVVLMYSDDLRKRLMGEEVSKVLGLLKVSVCLFYT